MSSKFLPMSRRTFLGGTLAAVVDCSAQHLPVARPMRIAIAASSEVSLEQIKSVTMMPEYNVLAIVAEKDHLPMVQKQLPIVSASSKMPRLEPDDGFIVLGEWRSLKEPPGINSNLPGSLYIDDPDLALRLAKGGGLRSFRNRTMVGFDILADPSYEFAHERIRDRSYGRLTRIAVTSRKSSRRAALEVAAATFRFESVKKPIQTLWLGTRGGRPSIHLCFEKGQIAIPLYSPEEREEGLPIRLRQFAELTRAENNRAISLNELTRCISVL
jgi:hypothetical protein